MICTHKFSVGLSGVVFLLVLLESVAAQSSNLQTFVDGERSDEPGQNIVSKKFNERNLPENEIIEKYKLAIASSPGDALLHNNLGVQYALIKRYEEAYRALKKSIELDSDSADAYFNLSKVAELLGLMPEAIELAQKALTIDGKNPRANIQFCQLLTVSENNEEAVKCFEKIPSVVTLDSNILAVYGIALINAGKLKKASAILGEKNDLYADDKSVQNALGVLYFTKKRYKQAVKYFARAIEIAPGYQVAHFNLALAQLSKKDKRGAFVQYMILKKTNVKLAEKLYRYMYTDKILYVSGK